MICRRDRDDLRQYLQRLARLDPDVRRIGASRPRCARLTSRPTPTTSLLLARAGDFQRSVTKSTPRCAIAITALHRQAAASSRPRRSDVIAFDQLSSLVVRRNFAMAGVGFVRRSEARHHRKRPTFLVRRRDIDTVVVYGVVGGTSSSKARSRTHSCRASIRGVAPNEEAFGQDEGAATYGGGRRDKAFHSDRLSRSRHGSLGSSAARQARARHPPANPATK
jgi:hypothetical protein